MRRVIWLAVWPGNGELLTEAEVLARSSDPLAVYWDLLPKLAVHLRCWAGGHLEPTACRRCTGLVTRGDEVSERPGEGCNVTGG
jgi:hypothetical protein